MLSLGGPTFKKNTYTQGWQWRQILCGIHVLKQLQIIILESFQVDSCSELKINYAVLISCI